MRRLPAIVRWPHLPDTVLTVSVCALDLAFFSEIGGNLDNTPQGSPYLAAVIAFAAAGAAPLWWRRRAPIVVFGLAWIHAMLGLLVLGYQPFLGLLVSLYSVGVYLSAGHAWVAPVALAPYALVSWDQATQPRRPRRPAPLPPPRRPATGPGHRSPQTPVRPRPRRRPYPVTRAGELLGIHFPSPCSGPASNRTDRAVNITAQDAPGNLQAGLIRDQVWQVSPSAGP